MTSHQLPKQARLTGSVDAILSAFASPFTQDQRLFTLRFPEGSGIADGTLLPHHLRGIERLSGTYLYQVEVLSADAHLEAKDFLGQPAVLAILLADGGERLVTGIVTAFGQLASDGSAARYVLHLEPCLAVLAHRFNAVLRQDMTVPDVLRDVFERHRQNNPVIGRAFRVEFRLSGTYPTLSYCNQYESDLHFVERLMAEHGLFYFFEFSLDNGYPVHTLVVCDDPYLLPAGQQPKIRFAGARATESEDTLTQWSGLRRMQPGLVRLTSFEYKNVTVDQASEQSWIDQGEAGNALASTLEDFDPRTHYYASGGDSLERHAKIRQEAYDFLAKQFSGTGTVRSASVGTSFELADHPVHDQDNPEQRQFMVVSLVCEAKNNFIRQDEALPNQLLAVRADIPTVLAPWFGNGQSLLEEGRQPYRVVMDCVRRGVPLRPRYAHTDYAKPTAPGPMTATVVGATGAEIHTDELGRIKIEYEWQLPHNHPNGGAGRNEKSSAWVRVATPWAGAHWGARFTPRVGQEAVIVFLNGDLDRPVCVGTLSNGTHQPPHFSGTGSLPANKALSGIRTKEVGGSQYNELLFDDTTGEVRAKLSSEHGKTQLNLGHLVHPRTEGKGEPRGDGFELRTDSVGAIRAAKGLLVSAWARMQANDKQLAREEFNNLLTECYELFAQLGKYAAEHQAMELDPKPQEELKEDIKNWENGSNTAPKKEGGGKPVIGITAPAGLGFATQNNIVSYAAKNLDSVARQHLQLTAGQRFNVNAGTGISLFSHKGGLKAIAHYGKLELQAQHDDIVANASENMMLTATHGKIAGMAGKEVVFVTGGGAYLKLSGANVEIGCPGNFTVKSADYDFSGPASMSTDLPTFKEGELSLRKQLINPQDGKPVKDASYRTALKDGRVFEGKTGADGKTTLIRDDRFQIARTEFSDDKRDQEQ